MNHRAKFDATSLILGGEIRNRTKWQNYKKKQTNSNWYNIYVYITQPKRKIYTQLRRFVR